MTTTETMPFISLAVTTTDAREGPFISLVATTTDAHPILISSWVDDGRPQGAPPRATPPPSLL